MITADLHIHTRYSPDSIITISQLFSRAQKQGLDAIAITDHDTTLGWVEALKESEHWDVSLILGIEKMVTLMGEFAGEVLCLFLEKPPISTEYEDVLDEVEQQGGIVSIAHPFDRRRFPFRFPDDFPKDRTVFIEVLNGRTYRSFYSNQAAELAQKLDLGVTAGSDAHTPFEIGNVRIEADASSPDQLKDSLLSMKEIHVKGHSSSPFYTILSGVGKIFVDHDTVSHEEGHHSSL